MKASTKNKKTEYIYLALFNQNIYEGSDEIISVHKTKSGAKKATKDHEINLRANVNKKNNFFLTKMPEDFSNNEYAQKEYKTLSNYIKKTAPIISWSVYKSSRKWSVKKIELLE